MLKKQKKKRTTTTNNIVLKQWIIAGGRYGKITNNKVGTLKFEEQIQLVGTISIYVSTLDIFYWIIEWSNDRMTESTNKLNES